MKRQRLGWMRLIAVTIAGLLAVLVFIDGFRDAAARASKAEIVFGTFVAIAILGGGFLVALRPDRAGMFVLLGALAVWVLWVIVTAPAAFDRLIPRWIALGIAAALASQRGLR